MLFTKKELAILYATKRKTMQNIAKILKNNQLEYDHYTSRVKTETSILHKLEKHKIISDTKMDIFNHIHDIIGIRIVVPYIKNIYEIIDIIQQKYEIYDRNDYITQPKNSGYRSYHLAIKVPVEQKTNILPTNEIYVEIQIRTLGMDFWASVEHSLVYKSKSDDANTKLIHDELQNYANEIFHMDMRMQALADLHKLDITSFNMKKGK